MRLATLWLVLLMFTGCAPLSYSALETSALRRAAQLNAHGCVAYEQGHYDEAIELFHQAFESYPDNYRIVANLAQSYRMHGEYARAVELFRVAATSVPADEPNRQMYVKSLEEELDFLRLTIFIEENPPTSDGRLIADPPADKDAFFVFRTDPVYKDRVVPTDDAKTDSRRQQQPSAVPWKPSAKQIEEAIKTGGDSEAMRSIRIAWAQPIRMGFKL